MNAKTENALQLTIDIGERIFVLLLFANFVAGLMQTIVLRPYNILVLLSEGLIAFFILVRRPARNVTTRPLDWLVALVCTGLPMLVGAGGVAVAPVPGAMLMLVGLCFSIWAKLSLRRSFGLAAANRGTVILGPYRYVRHPMYLGYMLVYCGFLLNNPLLWNLCIYATVFILFFLRISAEETILQSDPAYQAYRDQVRFRLVPALF